MAKKFRFSFDFGLKPGEDGDPGNDGRDGIDGRDGVDGIDGTDGLDGISPRFRYAKTANKDTQPTYIEDNINPGSNWGAVIPLHTSPEAIWMIQAEVSSSNELLSNWTIPVRITGVDGMDAEPPLPPNYKIFVFKESEELPAKPTYTNVDSVDKQGWVDFPDTSSGTWWEVTGNVNGVTGDIIEWGEPIRKTPVITDNENGEDGDSTETRRAYGQSASTAPSVNRTLREPPGWEIDLGTPPAGNYYVWEITARIKADNTLGGTPAQWSVPYRLTGNIGVSVVPEYRWAVNTSLTTPPAINVENRNPGAAWSTTMPIPGEDEYVWETVALINDDNELYSVWSNPVRKTGERGPQGQTGPIGERGPTGLQGTSGIPGVSYENRFSLGTESGFSATFNGTVAQTRNPGSSGWSLDIPETTEQNPYIWMIQARIQRATNEDPTGALEGVWSTPFMLTGLNGLPGESRDAQVVYPQGTYDNNTTYVATDRVAPYVLDPLDGNFYVMNFIGEYRGADNNNVSPAQDYANNAGVYWHLIPAHEAIYTKLGIIANGLIGEAVFNNQYMFSQGGVNSSGSPSTNYELFNPSTPTGGAFTPNMMINFANGEARFARGNVVLGADGSVEITGKFESSSSGDRITIDPEDPSLSLIKDEQDIFKVDLGTGQSQVQLNSYYAPNQYNNRLAINPSALIFRNFSLQNQEEVGRTALSAGAGDAFSHSYSLGGVFTPRIQLGSYFEGSNRITRVVFDNLPTTQPVTSGQLWRDPSAGNVLKVAP